MAEESKTDYILAGGSLTFNSIDNLIDTVRKLCTIPVILFPGNLLQLSYKADSILLLSLISGRNPELLIGNHVIAAPYLKEVREKLISVGYILISCGAKTSVEYISQTEAIPSDKPDIAVATALAGEMLGLQMIYLEAGSGATNPVPVNLVRAVKENISIPLAIGGGIKNKKEVKDFSMRVRTSLSWVTDAKTITDLLTDACMIRDELRRLS